MTFPYKAVRKEKEALFSLEKERLLGVIFARVLKEKERFLCGEELIKNGGSEVELTEIAIDLKNYKEVYRPHMKVDLVKGEGGQFLADCTIEIPDKKGRFFIFLKKNSL